MKRHKPEIFYTPPEEEVTQTSQRECKSTGKTLF